MKQSIKKILASLILSLSLISYSFAQDMYAGNNVKATEAVVTPAEGNNEEADLARNNFTALFPEATEQKWTKTNDARFVSFLNNGRKANASFNLKGNLNYALTKCDIENLPAAFSKILKSEYASYKLFHAIEISAYGKTAYRAVIENTLGFVTLKYTSDGVEEIQSVTK